MDIRIEKLNKNYADKAVFDNFDIVFPDKKISVVMGKSGEGKTTLLNCMAGIETYGGKITGIKSVSYVFQSDRLIPFKTVYENLGFTLDGRIKKEERARKIGEILKAVSLENEALKNVEKLSGGQRKRVSIARAFLSDADTLLADEPLNSLDLGLRAQTVSLLLDMVESYPKTVLYVTHDIDEALSVADCVFVIGKNGVKYSHEFSSEKRGRDILSDECNKVKRQLMQLLV